MPQDKTAAIPSQISRAILTELRKIEAEIARVDALITRYTEYKPLLERIFPSPVIERGGSTGNGNPDGIVN